MDQEGNQNAVGIGKVEEDNGVDGDDGGSNCLGPYGLSERMMSNKGIATSDDPGHRDRLVENETTSAGRVPKIFQGLEPGGPLPGAYEVGGGASGDLPAWQPQGSINSPIGCWRTEDVDIVDAELARSSYENQDLVIDGVKTSDPMHRILGGILAILALVALAAGIITRHRFASSPDRTELEGGSVATTPTSSPLVNMSYWTLADAIINEGNGGSTIGFYTSSISGKIFLELVNRTDTAFTQFAISGKAKQMEGVPLSLLQKMMVPQWYGHVNNAVEQFLVQGQALALEDMYDGMVLTSVAGYPLVIQLNPFRVNNISVSASERNLIFENAIRHTFVQYPNPLAPWIGKSTFDVLLELNEKRGGDVSHFIDLIKAETDLHFQLQLHMGDTNATTLFVPTNEALATLEPGALVNPFLNRLLLNHLVSGNFVKSRWNVIPTGTHVSSTELLLESQAGQVLELKINDDVTINGDATIVQGDVYSEQGILHIIDRPLIFSSLL